MADIKFACPHCAQHITCDELWGGHQLDCPNCKNPLMVPAMPAAEAPAAKGPQSLVPKPPAAVEPRLAINQGHAASQGPTGAKPVIPIRNLAPPPPKKKNAIVMYGSIAAVLIVLGVGVYIGYPLLSGMQDKVSTASKNSDGGEVGHIANLNRVLDATEPGKLPADGRTPGPRQRRSAVGQEVPVQASADAGAASTNSADAGILIPAVWTLDVTKARIPSGRANGSIAGTNFIPDTARIDPVGNAQVLRLIQGQPVSPDREMLVYLHLKSGEKPGGQTLSISQDTIGVGVPQVTKRWKTKAGYAPQYKSFNNGYAMRLELGQAADGAVPGKIFLALPDPDQSVVAGNFRAIINTNAVVETTVQTMTTAIPTAAPDAARAASDAAFQARYGTRQGGR